MKKLALLFLCSSLLAMPDERSGSYKQYMTKVIATQPTGQSYYNEFVEAARVPGSMAENCAECVRACGVMSVLIGGAISSLSAPLAAYKRDLESVAYAVISGSAFVGGAHIAHRMERDIIFHTDKEKKD